MMAETDITHRRVLNIAVPIVLANVTVPILGVVDTGVVGQLGEAAPIGAVGIGAVILTALYWVFGFLRMGTTGLTSQALGAGDVSEVKALLLRVLFAGGCAGFAIIALQVWLFAGAFVVSPASPEVETLARDYMAIRVWSAPAMIAMYGITGWLIAQERTRAILVIQLVMNGTNILLDLLFVLHFHWGVSGVAWATFIAEWSGLALGLWFCRAGLSGLTSAVATSVFDRIKLRRMAIVNGDIMIRSLLLQSIFISFLFFGARFGDVQLAANHILMQFLAVTAFALDGFAFGAESLVGQALGARSRAKLRRAVILTSGWGAGIGVALSLCFALFGSFVISVMTTAQDVREAAATFLPYMVAAPFVGAASWMLDGVFIGATRTADMRNMMTVSAVAYFVTVIPLMAIFGNHGLWLGLLISFVVRGATLAWKYPALEAEADRP